MRAALFLRMPNCNAFAGRFPCPISWVWKMASIFDSHPARLSNLGDKIWSLDAVKWNMTPVFDSWPGRGYDLGGQIRVSTWSRIWFEGSNWISDLPGGVIWGVRLDHRPPGRLIWGVKLDQRPPGRLIWGVRLDQRPPGRVILGVKLDQRPPGRLIWGVESDFLPVLPQNIYSLFDSRGDRNANIFWK